MMEGIEQMQKEQREKENARQIALIAQELKEIKQALKEIAANIKSHR